MRNKLTESTVSSYKNPFDDYNANVLDPGMIMQYWCTPFSTGALKEVDETRLYTEKMPIVLQGSRGSGKTTILKYLSFPVQCERAIQSHISVREQIKKDSGVGFYLRCDDSFLDMFKNVFSAIVQDAWQQCFKHYLELFFTKNILEMFSKIDYTDSISEDILLSELKLSYFGDDLDFKTLSAFTDYIDSELRYINRFKNEALFTNASFTPRHIWDFYDLSGLLINSIKLHLPEFKNTLFLLLIDEFENLPIELQKMLNTLIKFCKPGITMRVGRRSEKDKIVTKETVNSVEYLREGHDYRLIPLDYQGQDIQDLKPYLIGIAEKRLAAFEGIDISTNIVDILGDKENLDTECEEIINGRTTHLEYLLRANQTIAANDNLCRQIIQVISYPDNRIAETLCALWVARANEKSDLINDAQIAASAMHSYFEKTSHPLREKFANDYNNKYRHALTSIICAAYKKDKAYYSFNTLSYLSEGNARTFINLCKSIISDALFYEKNKFLSTGKISTESQRRAIKAYAIAEFNSVCSIIKDGKSIRNLILGIGNVLTDYHKDRMVRYPETTQFIYNPDDLSETGCEIVDIAESWALINRRNETLRLSASIKQEGYLYTLNRVFAPIFNISVRIRGGVNISFSSEEIDQMIAGKKISKLAVTRKKHGGATSALAQASDDGQISIFDGGDNE